tara:strand:- start:6858 stop:7916 length:1059 start_codon:yes stop_codon:yes gene_type:complete
MRKFFFIAINTFIILLVINLIIVIYPEKIIQKKYLNNKLISYFGYLHHVYYTETFNRNLKEIKRYTAIVGDSYALGSSEDKMNDGVAYYFKKNNPEEDFFQIGYPAGPYEFQEKILEKIIKKLKKNPDKIFLFIYEGNDFYDELSYNSKNKKDLFKKRLKLIIYNNFPIFAYALEKIFIKVIHINADNNHIIADNNVSKSLFNEIIVNKEKIKINNVIQNACSSLIKKQKIAFRESLSNYLNTINNKYYNIEKKLVYIPSPATLYNYKEVYSKNYISNQIEVFSKKENLKCHNEFVEIVLTTFNELKFDNFDFLNTTPQLQKISKNELIHGSLDINHFNNKGYKIFSDILLK